MNTHAPQVSIVIPTLNEAHNIETLVLRIHDSLKVQNIPYEIIFVDDRSTDSTISLIKKLQTSYPIKLIEKENHIPRGKACSILEGTKYAASENIIMLDADLQYPPEVIPLLLEKAKTYGVVIAERKTYKSNLLRRFGSRLNAFIFGRLLFGLNFDTQSGLKLFRREIAHYIENASISPWALDIHLLFTARELGYSIGTIPITFELRQGGDSKINFAKAAF